MVQSGNVRRFPPFLVIAFLVCGLLAHAALWWTASRPRPVEPSWEGVLESVSFAPFREGQSPLDRIYPNDAQLEEDMALVGSIARGIRTYTSREGMERAPDLARKYGVKMIHSAWLGGERDINAKEVESLIEAARTHPDVIERVIVGNEVLLRNDLPLNELISYIDTVRSSVTQPVSYADVWAFWLKNPSLAEHVDFITIHILPYWEDEPAPVEDMDGHFEAILKEVRAAFPNKPILIGEAGWPTEGRSRGPAAATTENAAKFVRMLPHLAEKYNFSYNVVEMFDQHWKSKLEGTVGARWGIYDVERQQKFSLSGSVEPIVDWRLKMGLALGISLALMGWFLRSVPGDARGRDIVVYGLLLNVLGAALAQSAIGLVQFSFTTLWLGWAVLRIAGLVLCTILVCQMGKLWNDAPPARAGFLLYQVYGAFAVIKALFFAFDGRYRDLPTDDFLVPVVGILMLMIVHCCAGKPEFGLSSLTRALALSPEWRKRARYFFWLLILSAAVSPFGEALAMLRGSDFILLHPTWGERIPLLLAEMASNGAVLWWTAMLAVLALPFGMDGYGKKFLLAEGEEKKIRHAIK